MTTSTTDTNGPVHWLPGEVPAVPADGVGLCLSGGGYRAMLFHVGVLRRLHEAGWLGRLTRISSVSGGSLTAATLALAWPALDLTSAHPAPGPFVEHVETRLRAMARVHVDVRSIVEGGLLPGQTIADRVASHYRDALFGDATLRDLPDAPTFVINATNVGTGNLFRFTKAYLADWQVGRVHDPDVPLATAVAASSAFPPYLSPLHLDLSDRTWTDDEEPEDTVLTDPAYRQVLHLSDGGVYDNLGLEPVWKRCRTVLVSDAGGAFVPETEPAHDWARHVLRVLDVIDHQVRSLRKGQTVEGLRAGPDAGGRAGVYVGTRSEVARYPVDGEVLPADPAVTAPIAAIATRLSPLDEDDQERLINWGYVIMDAGLRSHVDPGQPVGTLPYPEHPLGAPRDARRQPAAIL